MPRSRRRLLVFEFTPEAHEVLPILGIHETAEEMDEAEPALITPDQCYNMIPGGAGGRPSHGQDGTRRMLIDANGVFSEGRICVIVDSLGISQKKISDVVAGRRKCYRGLRAA